MKIIIRNSAVEFQNYEPLLNAELTFNSASWQYLNLNGVVSYHDVIDTIAEIPTGTTLTAIQVKPYINNAISNNPIFLINKYNETSQTTSYNETDITQVGVYVNAESFPVTLRVKIEK